MGLFNRINLNMGCPHCGQRVEWQSKYVIIDGIYPVQNCLESFDVNSRMDAEVYTYCGGCDWVTDLEIKKGGVVKKSVKYRKPKKVEW